MRQLQQPDNATTNSSSTTTTTTATAAAKFNTTNATGGGDDTALGAAALVNFYCVCVEGFSGDVCALTTEETSMTSSEEPAEVDAEYFLLALSLLLLPGLALANRSRSQDKGASQLAEMLSEEGSGFSVRESTAVDNEVGHAEFLAAMQKLSAGEEMMGPSSQPGAMRRVSESQHMMEPTVLGNHRLSMDLLKVDSEDFSTPSLSAKKPMLIRSLSYEDALNEVPGAAAHAVVFNRAPTKNVSAHCAPKEFTYQFSIRDNSKSMRIKSVKRKNPLYDAQTRNRNRQVTMMETITPFELDSPAVTVAHPGTNTSAPPQIPTVQVTSIEVPQQSFALQGHASYTPPEIDAEAGGERTSTATLWHSPNAVVGDTTGVMPGNVAFARAGANPPMDVVTDSAPSPVAAVHHAHGGVNTADGDIDDDDLLMSAAPITTGGIGHHLPPLDPDSVLSASQLVGVSQALLQRRDKEYVQATTPAGTDVMLATKGQGAGADGKAVPAMSLYAQSYAAVFAANPSSRANDDEFMQVQPTDSATGRPALNGNTDDDNGEEYFAVDPNTYSAGAGGLLAASVGAESFAVGTAMAKRQRNRPGEEEEDDYMTANQLANELANELDGDDIYMTSKRVNCMHEEEEEDTYMAADQLNEEQDIYMTTQGANTAPGDEEDLYMNANQLDEKDDIYMTTQRANKATCDHEEDIYMTAQGANKMAEDEEDIYMTANQLDEDDDIYMTTQGLAAAAKYEDDIYMSTQGANTTADDEEDIYMTANQVEEDDDIYMTTQGLMSEPAASQLNEEDGIYMATAAEELEGLRQPVKLRVQGAPGVVEEGSTVVTAQMAQQLQEIEDYVSNEDAAVDGHPSSGATMGVTDFQTTPLAIVEDGHLLSAAARARNDQLGEYMAAGPKGTLNTTGKRRAFQLATDEDEDTTTDGVEDELPSQFFGQRYRADTATNLDLPSEFFGQRGNEIADFETGVAVSVDNGTTIGNGDRQNDGGDVGVGVIHSSGGNRSSIVYTATRAANLSQLSEPEPLMPRASAISDDFLDDKLVAVIEEPYETGTTVVMLERQVHQAHVATNPGSATQLQENENRSMNPRFAAPRSVVTASMVSNGSDSADKQC